MAPGVWLEAVGEGGVAAAGALGADGGGEARRDPARHGPASLARVTRCRAGSALEHRSRSWWSSGMNDRRGLAALGAVDW